MPQKIIILTLSFLYLSCGTAGSDALLKKKISQVMAEFYSEKSASWDIVEVLNTENNSLADGYKFIILLKVEEIERFVSKNKDKTESLLNDPVKHFSIFFSNNSSFSGEFKNNKCEYFSHTLKLKDSNREANLFVAVNLYSNLVIVDYSEH
jgi:hypothetical protein